MYLNKNNTYDHTRSKGYSGKAVISIVAQSTAPFSFFNVRVFLAFLAVFESFFLLSLFFVSYCF